MTFYIKTSFFALLGLLFLASCNLTQEVDLELPEYEEQIVVESYLEPGQPFLLTLVKSSGFFDDIELDYVREATVTITHEGNTDTLQPLEIDILTPGIEAVLDTALLSLFEPIIGQGLYLYGSFSLVPEFYNTDFSLQVTTKDGQKLSAVTQIPSPIESQEMEYRFNDDTMALVLTTFQDDPNTVDYYRRLLVERKRVITTDSITMESDTTFVNDVDQDFTIDDEVSNGGPIVFGTGFDYEEGDTLISTLFHVTNDYYRFIATRDAAIQASFSPFGQPAVVYTNITGGIGLFTGFTRRRAMIVVGE
ncbi:MAG: DUF4249 domain-containing protein [Bacteroidota bacterium]